MRWDLMAGVVWLGAMVWGATVSGCNDSADRAARRERPEQAQTGVSAAIEVSSVAFRHGEMIPPEYACDGKNVSPPIVWQGVPAGAKSLVLIATDPDAPGGVFTHWVVYNIPPVRPGLEAEIPNGERPDREARQGRNDFGTVGYGGPCPPSGTHRYFFRLYALDTELSFSGEVGEEMVREAMKGHVVGEGELMGRYQRGQ